MIIESGLIIFLGMLFLGIKLPKTTSLKLLGHPLALDLSVSTIVYVLHWGTFTGVMAAAVAGMLCSLSTSAARKIFGYIEKGEYRAGFLNVMK